MAPEESRAAAQAEVSMPVLRWWARGLCGSLGAAAAGGGAVAVFDTDNEVGSAALLAIGVYFIIAAILGRMPKIKLGDNEIDPTSFAQGAIHGVEKTTKVVEEVVKDSSSPEEVVVRAREAGAELEQQYAELLPKRGVFFSSGLGKTEALIRAMERSGITWETWDPGEKRSKPPDDEPPTPAAPSP